MCAPSFVQHGQNWKLIASLYANELKRVCNGDGHRLQLRYRSLTRKDGIVPTPEEMLLAMAECVDDQSLVNWIARRRSVRQGWRRSPTSGYAAVAWLTSACPPVLPSRAPVRHRRQTTATLSAVAQAS